MRFVPLPLLLLNKRFSDKNLSEIPYIHSVINGLYFLPVMKYCSTLFSADKMSNPSYTKAFRRFCRINQFLGDNIHVNPWKFKNGKISKNEQKAWFTAFAETMLFSLYKVYLQPPVAIASWTGIVPALLFQYALFGSHRILVFTVRATPPYSYRTRREYFIREVSNQDIFGCKPFPH